MVPSVIVEITWHVPGGRYHSPSIITAHRRRCHAHQRPDQCRTRKRPVDILLRRHPIFQHAEKDHRAFRMFTAQLICQGACRQVDIVRIFGVSRSCVIRSVNTYPTGGVDAFYGAQGQAAHRLVRSPEVFAQACLFLRTDRMCTDCCRRSRNSRHSLAGPARLSRHF